MKTFRIAFVGFITLAALACSNHQQGKKPEADTTKSGNPTTEEPIIKIPDKTEQKKIELCEDIATEIVATSPRYRQLTKGLYNEVLKNGGQSFGISLESGPNTSQDKALRYSKTYDFTLYEMYPDRQLNTARFSFDPNKKQLFEYDEINDQQKPIDFDRNLLLKFDSVCN